jgi:hypothetical protein
LPPSGLGLINITKEIKQKQMNEENFFYIEKLIAALQFPSSLFRKLFFIMYFSLPKDIPPRPLALFRKQHPQLSQKYVVFFLCMFLVNQWFIFRNFHLCCPSQRAARSQGPSEVTTYQEIGSQLWAGETPDSNPGLQDNSLAHYH